MLSSDTRDRIVCMPGWDKLHDLCLVIGELTAAMLAGSALHRGMATMVLNLVSHTTSHAYDPSTEPLGSGFFYHISHFAPSLDEEREISL